MQLTDITQIEGYIEIRTGLHIGSGDAEMHIGGTDNPVIKHPHTNEPYIPGSSLKGKMRSLLEWRSGRVKEKPLGYSDCEDGRNEQVKAILQLFSVSGSDQLALPQAEEIGPTRLAFWDCALDPDWRDSKKEQSHPGNRPPGLCAGDPLAPARREKRTMTLPEPIPTHCG